MPWVISFIVSWILFFALVDYKTLRKNCIAGLATLALASIVDYGGQKIGLYAFYYLIIPWFGCSAFYKFGPVFTMGVIFAQHVPDNKWMQALNILICSLLFLMLELAIMNAGAAQYLKWNYYASFTVDVLAFSSLTWFTTAFLRDKN